MTDRHKALQRIADFDHIFTVSDNGTVADCPEAIYAPTVTHDEDADIDIDSPYWEALTGYTGQYGYNGACMHASEYLGGRLADDVLDNPGVYVVTAVYSDDDESPDSWCVLRYTGDDDR